MSTVSLQELQRWQATAEATKGNPFSDEASSFDEVGLGPPSKFPFEVALNNKIALWRGDLTRLAVDAIVNSTNESLTDRSGLCGQIHEAAGPDLHQECMTLEGCRTGEAKLTKGHRLPSKFIVHTVGPRYNVKYKTAAENALHACYRSSLQVVKESGLRSIAFPPLYTERKGYPRNEAPHIALRTIRRFLEHWGDTIHTVVLVVDSEADESIYENIMPLYFPRNKFEEDAARKMLPEDIGNEFGESVTEERKIKIAAGPGGRTAPTTSSAATQSLAAGAAAGAAGHAAGAAGGSGPAGSATSSTTAQVPRFGEMRGDIDRERAEHLQKEAATTDKETENEREYQRYLKRARTENLSDIEKRNIIRQTGVDALGRPIVVVVARNLPTKSEMKTSTMSAEETMERVLLYFIKVLDSVVEKDYVLVYIHTNFQKENQPEYAWLKQVYSLFSRKYKKNLKQLFIVHPSFWLKMIFWFLTPFISPKFWKKLVYINRIYDLFEKIDRKQLEIPHEVFEYDQQINGSNYHPDASTL